MLDNRKRVYMLGTFTVECKASGWYFKKSYGDDKWRGPYGSETSVCLMIARQLKREFLKRDRLPE